MKSLCWTLPIFIILWILPLGFLIKPSMEQKSCGGKRAVHMCMNQMTSGSASATSAKDENTSKIKTGSGIDQIPSASSGIASDYLLNRTTALIKIKNRSKLNSIFLIPKYQSILTNPSPIPKI